MVGRTLSHFRVIDEIGRGGMGVVYRARDVRLDRDVALKVLPPELISDPERKHRFLQEARAAASVVDPHIAVVHEVDEAEGVTFIAMELLRGDRLSDVMRREPLPMATRLDLAAQIASALATAHEHGIVHRDIKPANIMVDERGQAKIIDFGLAKLREPASTPDGSATTALLEATAPGRVMGTVPYMSPEQARGTAVDHRTDIWSFGVVLYELVAGRKPFDGTTPTDVLTAILRDPPPPLPDEETLPATVNDELRRVLDRCLAKERDRRYQSARDVVLDLEAVRRRLDLPTALPVAPRARRRRAGAVALAAAALALAVGIGWAILARRPMLAFEKRDWLLVTDVGNDTGEDVFDVALKVALETDLRQSRYVNVFDQTQVQNAVRLLRLPATAPIGVETGRKVCQLAGVRALVSPRIVRAGAAYLLEASLVEPATGRVVGQVRATARGREAVLLEAIDELASRLRSVLGESLSSIAESDPPLAQYTSSSLEALKLLQLGANAWGAADLTKAARFFEQALEEDPHFAAARGSLGLVKIQFLGQPQEGKALLIQALADSSDVSKREHLMIRALHRQFALGDLQGALNDYRAIIDLYPDMMQPYNNSGRILQELGRYREAAENFERARQVDPRSPIPVWNLWYVYIGPLADPDAAETVARVAVQLQPDVSGAHSALGYSLAARRRFAEAEAEVQKADTLDPSNPYALPYLGLLYFRRGAWTDAVESYREVVRRQRAGRLRSDPASDALALGLALSRTGANGEAREAWRDAAARLQATGKAGRLPLVSDARLAVVLAADGRTADARRALERLERVKDPSADLLIELGRLAAMLGDSDRAIAFLERGVAAGFSSRYFFLLDPALHAIRDHPALVRLAPPGTIAQPER